MKNNEYELIRSNRKTIALSISKELKVIVKAPLNMPAKDIERFIIKHAHWIEKHRVMMRENNENRENNTLSDEQINKLRQKAKEVLPHKVDHYAGIMGVKPKGIKITSATTRWGSCSAKNSLCFPYRLMLLPDELIDYIVVHELSHIRIKNHSVKFYEEVAKYIPNFKERTAKLKLIQRKLPH